MSKSSSLTPHDAVAVTPSDTTQLNLCGFYVGGAGDVTVVTDAGASAGTTVVFKACPLGTKIDLLVFKLMATGTTATNITGFRA